MIDYYQLLNISPDATEAEIKKAIRQQRAKYRRRVDSSPDIDTRTMAEKKVEQIGEAEKILIDPEKRDAYDQQLKSAPAETSTDQPSKGESQDWVTVAHDYYDKGDIRKAYSSAKEATRVESNNDEGWGLRALLASRLENFDDADFAIAQALKMNPTSAKLHYIAGTVAVAEEDYNTATAEYKESVRLDPNDYVSLTLIGWVMGFSGKDEEGFQYLKTQHMAHPDNSYIAKNFVEYALDIMQKNFSVSAEQFETDVIPTNEAQVNLGNRYMKEIESIDVDDDDLNEQRREYKEMLDYAGKRHFKISKIFNGIKSIIVWLIAVLIINWLFHGFVHLLAIVIATAVLALALYLGLLPYGYELNSKKVGEDAAHTGLQHE